MAWRGKSEASAWVKLWRGELRPFRHTTRSSRPAPTTAGPTRPCDGVRLALRRSHERRTPWTPAPAPERAGGFQGSPSRALPLAPGDNGLEPTKPSWHFARRAAALGAAQPTRTRKRGTTTVRLSQLVQGERRPGGASGRLHRPVSASAASRMTLPPPAGSTGGSYGTPGRHGGTTRERPRAGVPLNSPLRQGARGGHRRRSSVIPPARPLGP